MPDTASEYKLISNISRQRKQQQSKAHDKHMGVSNRIIGLGRTHPDIIEDVIKVAAHQDAASKGTRWEMWFIFLHLHPCPLWQCKEATREDACLCLLCVEVENE